MVRFLLEHVIVILVTKSLPLVIEIVFTGIRLETLSWALFY